MHRGYSWAECVHTHTHTGSSCLHILSSDSFQIRSTAWKPVCPIQSEFVAHLRSERVEREKGRRETKITEVERTKEREQKQSHHAKVDEL